MDLEILFDLARLVQERTPLGEIYDLPEIAEDFALMVSSTPTPIPATSS